MKTVKHLSVLLALLLVVTLTVVGFAVNAAEDTITVSTADEFRAAINATNANKNIVLTQDIDLGETGNTTMSGAAFTGSFDGQGHTVSGITSTLFDNIGGTFKNVILKGSIDQSEGGNRFPATVAHEAKLGTAVIENVVSYVDIKAACGNVNAGGIVGYTKYGFLMKNCEYAGTFHLNWTSTNAGFAGLVGWSNTGNSKVVIENSMFTGKLVLDVNSPGQMYLGGIIGHAGSSSAGAKIVDCVNTGTIVVNDTTSTGVWIGGIVGKFNNNNQHIIDSCVNNGTYSIPEMFTVSGMVGLIEDDASIGSVINNSVSLYDDGEYSTLEDVRGVTVYNSYLAKDISKIGEPVDIDGVQCQKYNFGYLEVATSKLVDLSASFEEGTITQNADGSYSVDTDSYAAFLSFRNSSMIGAQDYRFLIAADYDLLLANPNLQLSLQFTKNNLVVKSLTKSVRSDLKVYASVTAAGNVYKTADGCVLTGIVITDIPADAWDDVSIKLIDADGIVICDGEVNADELYRESLTTISGLVTDFESMTEDELVLGHLDGSIKNLLTVSATVAAGKGVNGSNALAACRTEWYDSKTDNNMEVKWQLAEPGFLGDNQYLVVWMDLATNNLDFRKACFGLLTDGNWYNPYRADDKESGTFFYKADGTDTWAQKTMGADGCFGAGDNCSVAGYKGYFAFPISDMYSGKTALTADSAISGIYFYMCALSADMTGKPVYVDNVQLVVDYTTVK